MNRGPSGKPAAGAGVVLITALVAIAAGASTAVALPLGLFRDGPPPAVTGGFGEDTCLACHWGDDDAGDPGGELRLLGVPTRFEAGEEHTLEIVLVHPDMRVGGFQLAARFAETGKQAGTVAPGTEEAERVSVLEQDGIQYIQHLLGGIALVAPDTARWTIVWTAPEAGEPVAFHVSAVAGDDDGSQIGDFVFTAEGKSRPGGH